MAKVVKSAALSAQKWQQNFSASGPAYQQGINNVQQSPMAAAAAQVQKAVQGYTEVLNNGSWASALNNVSLASWKAACAAGMAKFALGATKGAPKMLAFQQRFNPIYQQASDAAAAATGSMAKYQAAYNVLVAAGRKKGM